jgi:hypothetical protein
MISTDQVFLTMARVKKLPALAPLTEAGYIRATSESWKNEVDDDMLTPLHHWGGNIRLRTDR